MRHRPEINTVHDFNDHVAEILDDWLLDFPNIEGLTREPDNDDYDAFGHTDLGWVYTQRGMALYDSACSKLTRLGEKLFPDDAHDLDVKAYGMMLLP